MFHVAMSSRSGAFAGTPRVSLYRLRWSISALTSYVYWNFGFGNGGIVGSVAVYSSPFGLTGLPTAGDRPGSRACDPSVRI